VRIFIEHFCGVKIASQSDQSVIGSVMSAIISIKIIARYAFKVLHFPDYLVAVCVFLKSSFLNSLAKPEKGFIFITFTFRDDDSAFEFGFLHIKEAVAHAVGFQLEGDI